MTGSVKSKLARRALSLPNVALTLSGLLVLGGWATAGNSQAGGAPALKDGPGRDTFAQNCSACHGLPMITNSPRSSEEWHDTIQKMIGFGASLSAQDVAAIHGYLAANYNSDGASADAMPAVAAAATQNEGMTFPRPQGVNQWPSYGGGGAQLNFSPLTQITPANVARLTPAWTYRYGAGQSNGGDQGLDYRFEVTPLIIGGVMYISTPSAPSAPGLKASITALRPETGEVIWKYESPLNIHGRGLAYWPGDAETAPRVIFGTDNGMIAAVDVTTGRLAEGFGRRGMIDAYVGVVSEIVGDSRRSTFTIPNPVSVFKDVFITGARPGEAGPPAPRGDIRGWDAKTGRLLWTFHTVPQPGEAGNETYKNDSWRDTSGANVWSTMAVDNDRGIVFAPVGDLNNTSVDTGIQLYASSLLALDATTGKLLWHRQLVHRDMLDLDSPTPPVLIDYRKADGTSVPAVLMTGKQGLIYIFDRVTGEPLNGWEERPVPGYTEALAGQLWPTQPWPTAPGPISRVGMTRDEIPDLVPGMKEACQKFWDDNDIVSVPLYGVRRSTEHATISYPTGTGGPNWGGGAYNPQTGMFYIVVKASVSYTPKQTAAQAAAPVRTLRDPDAPQGAQAPQVPRAQRPAPPFTFAAAPGVNLSCGATPWAEMVAVDTRNLKVAWRTPLGDTEALGAAGLNTGTPALGGTLTTQSGLVFVGAANDRKLRAFDARNGRELWETQLEASAHSTPITYLGADGKQYVVAAASGGTSVGGPQMSDTLVAYKLP